MNGEWQRCKVEGSEKLNGSYKAYLDGKPNGIINNFKTGESEKWVYSAQSKQFSNPEMTKAEIQVKQEKRDLERDEKAKRVAFQATKTIHSLKKASPDNPYLQKKRVLSYGLKESKNGNLIVPATDIEGNIKTFQTIAKNGSKYYLKDGEKAGSMHIIDPQNVINKEPVIIAEGYATGATLHESTNKPVIVAFDSYNLKNVAEAVREKYPEKPIIIASDNDAYTIDPKYHKDYPDISKEPSNSPKWLELSNDRKLLNVGIIKANEASKAVNGALMIPRFDPPKLETSNTKIKDTSKEGLTKTELEKFSSQKLTDFNDLAIQIDLRYNNGENVSVYSEIEKYFDKALTEAKSLIKRPDESSRVIMGKTADNREVVIAKTRRVSL